jgi:hypothetical protein
MSKGKFLGLTILKKKDNTGIVGIYQKYTNKKNIVQ